MELLINVTKIIKSSLAEPFSPLRKLELVPKFRPLLNAVHVCKI